MENMDRAEFAIRLKLVGINVLVLVYISKVESLDVDQVDQMNTSEIK